MWTLVSPPKGLAAQGCIQQVGVDFDKIFNPKVKSVAIRTAFSLALATWWLSHQLDIKKAFLFIYLFWPRQDLSLIKQ